MSTCTATPLTSFGTCGPLCVAQYHLPMLPPTSHPEMKPSVPLLKEQMAAAVTELSDGQPHWEFSCDLEVDCKSEENASIVYAALAVDKELQPDKVKRHMTVSKRKLVVHFEAVEARFLRASFSAFVDVLALATRTIEEFGGGMQF